MRTERLTYSERRMIINEMKAGSLLALFIFILGLLFYAAGKLEASFYHFPAEYILTGGLFIASIVFYGINIKYMRDLGNDRKELHQRTVEEKLHRKDFEVGASAGQSISREDSSNYPGMRRNEIFLLKIDQNTYPVEKELWQQIHKGDVVYLHTAPLSKTILDITRKA